MSSVLENGVSRGTLLEERTTGGPPGHWIGNLAGGIVIESTHARDGGMNLRYSFAKCLVMDQLGRKLLEIVRLGLFGGRLC